MKHKAIIAAAVVSTIVGTYAAASMLNQPRWYNASTDCEPLSGDWKDPSDLPGWLTKWKNEHGHSGDSYMEITDGTAMVKAKLGNIDYGGIDYRALEFKIGKEHGIVLYMSSKVACPIMQKALKKEFGGIMTWKD